MVTLCGFSLFSIFVKSSSLTSSVCLLLMLSSFTSSVNIDPDDGGYQQVVVAISPKVPQNQASDVINALQETLRNTSSYLHEASGQRTWLKEVSILLPSNWVNLPSELKIEKAALENYDHADIRVSASGSWNQPYTQQPNSCGKPGQYIQINTQFLFNNNSHHNPGKVLLHEWSHLRYGVFDEFGYPGDAMYPLFYFNQQNEAVPNGCTNQPVVGQQINTLTNSYCKENPRTGLPEKNCAFIPSVMDNDDVTSSIMDAYYMDSVRWYCGSATGPRGQRERPHNSMAPNKHNNICQGRSVWDVIQSSQDFQVIPKRAQNVDASSTKFRIVQEQSAKYVLVVDTSTKRSDYSRDMTFYIATSKAVTYYFPLGSSIGIVEYSSNENTNLKVNLTKMNTHQDRTKMSGYVPDLASSSQQRCVICGINTAIDSLRYNAMGSNIILLTDGNVKRAELEEVKRRTREAKVRLFVLLYPQPLRNLDWEGAVRESGGKIFVIDEPRKNKDGSAVTTMQLEAAYLAILRHTLPQNDAPITVIQDVKELSKQIARSNIYQYNPKATNQGSLVTGTFSLDSPSNLVFSVYYYERGYIAEGQTRLIGPSRSYTQKDLKFEKYISHVFFIIDNAKNGTWQYEVVGKPPTQQPLIITAVAHRSKDLDSQPISIKGWMNVQDEVDPLKQPVKIYVELKKGDLPVIGARVVVYVEMISGNREQYVQPAPFLLRDNGNGDADITANDGIYSAYFTHFYNASRYKVRVKSDDNGGRAYINIPPASQSSSPTSQRIILPAQRTCCGSSMPVGTLESAGKFSREYTIGSLKIITEIDGDSFPPGRIGDLQLVENKTNIPNSAGTLVTLTWTAPGDDYDYGTAAKYELRYSTSRQDLTENFERAGSRVTEDIHGRYFAPQPAGSLEKLTIAMPSVHRDVVYYFAIRTRDEMATHRAKLSNIVQVLVKKTPRKPPPPPGGTDPPTTTVIKTGKKQTGSMADDEGLVTADWTIIVAVIIAFLVFVMIISIVIYFLFRRRKEPRRGPMQTKPGFDKAHIVAQLSANPPPTMSPVQSWPASTLLNHYDKVEEARMRKEPPPIMTYRDECDTKTNVSNNEPGSVRSSMSDKDEKARLDTSPDLTSSTPSLTPSANLSLRRVTQV